MTTITTKTTTITTTTKMTTDRKITNVAQLFGPILVVGALLLGGCADDGSAPAASPAPSTEAPSSTQGDTTTSEPAAPAPDAISEFDAAIDSLGNAYTFDSVVTTPAGDTVTVNGLRVADALAYSISSGGADVNVVSIGSELWIRQGDAEEWLQSTETAAEDPLEALRTPLAVEWADVSSRELNVTYNAEALDLPGTGTVVAMVSLQPDAISFRTTNDAASLETTLAHTPDPTTITAPA